MELTEIIGLSSESPTEHINALCAQNAEFYNVRAGGIRCYCCALRRQLSKSCFALTMTSTYPIRQPLTPPVRLQSDNSIETWREDRESVY